jgi:hypothetical protein
MFNLKVWSHDTIFHQIFLFQWYFPGTPVSPTNKTDRHNIAEISLKVVLNTITPPLHFDIIFKFCLCSHDTVLIRLSDGSQTELENDIKMEWGCNGV